LNQVLQTFVRELVVIKEKFYVWLEAHRSINGKLTLESKHLISLSGRGENHKRLSGRALLILLWRWKAGIGWIACGN
jgi:hypothetical protein